MEIYGIWHYGPFVLLVNGMCLAHQHCKFVGCETNKLISWAILLVTEVWKMNCRSLFFFRRAEHHFIDKHKSFLWNNTELFYVMCKCNPHKVIFFFKKYFGSNILGLICMLIITCIGVQRLYCSKWIFLSSKEALKLKMISRWSAYCVVQETWSVWSAYVAVELFFFCRTYWAHISL